MNTTLRTKWEIPIAISKGNQSLSLIETYKTDLEERIDPEELAQHKANVSELQNRRAGQPENLTNQKSKTLGQDEQITRLNGMVINIRNVVKSYSSSPEISKAFGVGEKLSKTVTSVKAGSNMIIAAYTANQEWSKKAGIIEKDILEIKALQDALDSANHVQENSKYARKSATMDKNTLQRAVEDMVTRISAVGVQAFSAKNPPVAQLFSDLIPSSGKAKGADTEENKQQ